MKIDVREHALNALETAKKDLRRDKYLLPVALVVTDDGVEDFNLDFENSEQKVNVYRELVKIAKLKRARAIITVNDAKITKGPDPKSGDTNKQKLHPEVQESVYVTVSGPSFRTWSLSLPYLRLGSDIVFGDRDESTGDFLGLLPGWPSEQLNVS